MRLTFTILDHHIIMGVLLFYIGRLSYYTECTIILDRAKDHIILCVLLFYTEWITILYWVDYYCILDGLLIHVVLSFLDPLSSYLSGIRFDIGWALFHIG